MSTPHTFVPRLEVLEIAHADPFHLSSRWAREIFGSFSRSGNSTPCPGPTMIRNRNFTQCAAHSHSCARSPIAFGTISCTSFSGSAPPAFTFTDPLSSLSG